MTAIMWDVADELLKRIGGDIEKRVKENPEAYHLAQFGLIHERRVGGQMAERINSAFVDWKFPNAVKVPMVYTHEKIEVNPAPSSPRKTKSKKVKKHG